VRKKCAKRHMPAGEVEREPPCELQHEKGKAAVDHDYEREGGRPACLRTGAEKARTGTTAPREKEGSPSARLRNRLGRKKKGRSNRQLQGTRVAPRGGDLAGHREVIRNEPEIGKEKRR